VLDWLRRLRKVSQKLSLPSRDASSGRSQIQLNPAKLTPSPDIYLGRLAHLTVTIAEQLDHQSENAGDSVLSKKLHLLSNKYYARHAELVPLLTKAGVTPSELDGLYGNSINQLLSRTKGADFFEDMMRDYIVFGMLEDSYRKLAKGLTASKRLKVEELLSHQDLEKLSQTALFGAIAQDPKLGHRLALFGRMVVADCLLEIRSSVSFEKVLPVATYPSETDRTRAQFKTLEPYTSELIAAHTVRMDQLGLTA
jgi:hypothetical protein